MGLEGTLERFCGDKFWPDSNQTGVPNVTVCFQHTVLVWVPVLFFWLMFPVLVMQGQRSSRRYAALRWSTSLYMKMICSLLLCVNSLALFIHVIFEGDHSVAVDYVYPMLWTVTWAAILLTHVIRHRKGMVTSGIIHITSVTFVVCGLPEMYEWGTKLHNGTVNTTKGSDMFQCVAYLMWFPLAIVHCILMCFADGREVGEKDKNCPELDSSFINRLTLWWFNAIPAIGSKKSLEPDDLFELNEGSTSEYLIGLWDKYWNPKMDDYRLRKSQWSKDSDDTSDIPPPSIVHTLFKMFKYEVLSATALKVLSDIMQFANPFLLNELIGFISDPHAKLWIGIAYSILMFTASELRSFVLNSYFYIMFRMGIKFQTVLTAAVYKKTMRLSNSARRDKTVGEIVNLMAIDVERFQLITPQIQQFWSCPFQITLALIYLFYTLGYAAAPGIVVMIVFIPMNILSSIAVRKWQMEQMTLKDERTKMVNEILNGMKVVKLYAWEVPMEEHIENIRQRELRLIKKASMVRNILDSFNTASPFLVAILSFGTYCLSSSDHKLTPQIAFVSLTLFNQLRSPMTMIALLINQMVQAVVSNKRLKEFLVAEELDSSNVERTENVELRNPSIDARDVFSIQEKSILRRQLEVVEMEEVDATWDETDNRKSTLTGLSLTATRGALVAVVGRVGTGKSSLLNCLLGEMHKLSGLIGVRGRVAYVPQQSWIQNMTLRDNILFGKPFDKKRYRQVIHACALKADLKILPHGDMTEIGEKGINLSGGQKARVSLARAVYQNYDVYLLDDPLSAVDSHVGRHIFNEVIGPNGLLKEKTRILVTHGLTFIRNADPIVVMQDGRIAEQGTYDELVKFSGVFADFVREIKETKSEEEESDDGTEEKERDFEEDMDDIELDIHSTQESPTKPTEPSSGRKSLEAENASKLIQKEKAEEGRVKMSVYRQYVEASTYSLSAIFTLGLTLFTVFQIGRSFWLSAWSDENDPSYHGNAMSIGWRLAVYGALGVGESLWFLLGRTFLVYAGLSASLNLHHPLIHNLMRSPMSFYDTTPLGRILNRCAKDIEVIDMLLPTNFRYFVMCILQVVSTLIVIVVSTPLFAVVILPLAAIYVWFLRYYVPTSRQLKRLEGVNRSPIYSHFGESIQGSASIRAFRKTDEFCLKSGEAVDRFIRCKYHNIVSNRWLAIRLEFIGNCVIFFAALFATLSKEWGWSTSAGVVGVSISYALNITEVLNFAVRQVSEIEANIVAVERVKEYTETENEAQWRIPQKSVPKNWPTHGQVKIVGYSTRYREGLDLVLRRVFGDIGAGEKIGIVGRTGAGKSSFALALFRMVEPVEGQIIVDGIDIGTIGLHDLRENITIIPQDPVLFSGTLRFNLDPFRRSNDEEIWRALELAHLKEMASNLPGSLDYVISEGGENISVGQRQLVCLARALLRKSRILVLDEATAAVDMQTDALIQTTIRDQFRDCTVFTIAHRLNTILDYDRIMVLDRGTIREFAPPDELLADRNSLFARMVADSMEQGSK